MALLFMDGFDHYAQADGGAKWDYFSATLYSSGGRRNGGYAAAGYINNGGFWKVVPNNTSLVMGFAFKRPVASSGEFMSLRVASGNDQQVLLYMGADDTLSIFRGGYTLLGTSAIGKLKPSIWNYIEWKITIATSIAANSCILKINGEEVINLAAGTNTKGSSAQDGVSRIHWYRPGGYDDYSYDDIYICDQSGTTCNNFLGDCRVDTIYPNIDGAYANGNTSSGSTHYTLVDEKTPNTSDYVTLSTVGDRDSYGYEDLPAITNTTIYGVQVNAYWQKDDGGSRSAAIFARSGTTNSDGTSVALANSYLYSTQVFATDPNTSVAWTRESVNNAEFGVTVTA